MNAARHHVALALLGLACLVLAAAFVAFNRAVPSGLTDEFDIVNPAIEYVTGNIDPVVKYGSFPFYLYGAAFALTGNLESPQASLVVARYVNFAIFLGGLALLWLIVRRLFSPAWASLACLLWLSLPGSVVAALVVKTEALQVLEILVVLYALQRLYDEPGRVRWQIVAAAGAALAIATKLNPLPLFSAALFYAYLRWHEPHRAPSVRPFVTGFCVVLALTWTNVWVMAETLRFWREDWYLLPGAGPFRAVSERFAFPYGTYSSFAFTLLPALLGVQSLYFVGALVLGEPRERWLRFAFGGGTALAIVIAIHLTTSRFTHPFTPYLLFFVVASTAFLRRVALAGPFRARGWNWLLAATLTAVIGVQSAYVAAGIPDMMESLRKHSQTLERINGTRYFMLMLPLRELTPSAGRTRKTLQRLVEEQHPRYLYVLSSYVANMCKYDLDDYYRANCNYYRRLAAGKAGYRAVETIDIAIPGKQFFFDPEIRDMAFHLFERDEPPGVPASFMNEPAPTPAEPRGR